MRSATSRRYATCTTTVSTHRMPAKATLVPQTEYAHRLEQVRASVSDGSFTQWVGLLHDNGYDIPLATARTYHTTRDPSPMYLRAVCASTGCDPTWLLGGVGTEFPASTYRAGYEAALRDTSAAMDALKRWAT